MWCHRLSSSFWQYFMLPPATYFPVNPCNTNSWTIMMISSTTTLHTQKTQLLWWSNKITPLDIWVTSRIQVHCQQCTLFRRKISTRSFIFSSYLLKRTLWGLMSQWIISNVCKCMTADTTPFRIMLMWSVGNRWDFWRYLFIVLDKSYPDNHKWKTR